MAEQSTLHYWTLWCPGGATGLYFGRGALDPTTQLLVHAAPARLNVEISAGKSTLLASAEELAATQDSPICLLTVKDDTITREDIWPTSAHHGLPVLLPGGEVGILNEWWHAVDQSEWRWQVTFYNHISAKS